MKIVLSIFWMAVLTAGVARADTITVTETVPEEIRCGSGRTARTLPVWMTVINGARETLDIEQFYLSSSGKGPMDRILSALEAAAGRGVRIRILADRAMLKESSEPLDRLSAVPGIMIRITDFRRRTGGVQHSKFFIADNSSVFAGSQNFDWRSLAHTHEVGLFLESRRAAEDFAAVFESDWSAASSAHLPDEYKLPPAGRLSPRFPGRAQLSGGEVLFYPVFSPGGFLPPGAVPELKELLKLIDGARGSISAQTMTYSLKGGGRGGWRELDDALRAAGRRGVSVKLIFSDWTMSGSNVKAIKSLAAAPGVQVRIASLPEHSSGFIPYSRVAHAKYITVDGRKSLVSTSNWSRDYFYKSRGAAIVMKGEPAASVLEDIFFSLWNSPYVRPVEQSAEYKPVRKKEE